MDNVEKVARAMFRSAFGDDPLGDKAAERLFEDHRFEYENLAQAALQSIGFERMREALERIAKPTSDDGLNYAEQIKYWQGIAFLDGEIARAALKGDSDRAALNRGEVG